MTLFSLVPDMVGRTAAAAELVHSRNRVSFDMWSLFCGLSCAIPGPHISQAHGLQSGYDSAVSVMATTKSVLASAKEKDGSHEQRA